MSRPDPVRGGTPIASSRGTGRRPASRPTRRRLSDWWRSLRNGRGHRFGERISLPAAPLGASQQSLRYYRRGYRYAERIPLPVSPLPVSSAEAENPLEAYFDAHTEGRGLFKWRHYFDIYHRHLQRFRGQPVHVLEIGVLGGGSLEMWRAYLGPDARLTGVDIDPECRALAPEGVEILIGDQADPEFWREYLATSPTIDVVIDDGGHHARQQAVTLESLLPHIRPGGVYICEDIHHPQHWFHAFIDGLSRPLNAVGMPRMENPASALQQHVASVHRYPLVTVIEKPAARPVFEAPRHGSVWPTRVSRPGARREAMDGEAPARD